MVTPVMLAPIVVWQDAGRDLEDQGALICGDIPEHFGVIFQAEPFSDPAFFALRLLPRAEALRDTLTMPDTSQLDEEDALLAEVSAIQFDADDLANMGDVRRRISLSCRAGFTGQHGSHAAVSFLARAPYCPITLTDRPHASFPRRRPIRPRKNPATTPAPTSRMTTAPPPRRCCPRRWRRWTSARCPRRRRSRGRPAAGAARQITRPNSSSLCTRRIERARRGAFIAGAATPPSLDTTA